MTAPRKPRSIGSYGPHLLGFYRKAATTRVVVEFSNSKDPITWRHRLHSLRAQMREDKHPEYPIAEKVRVSIDGHLLIGQPWDDHVAAAFEAAGIVPAEAEALPEGFLDQIDFSDGLPDS